jgi:CheY-like chemotaxis protein
MKDQMNIILVDDNDIDIVVNTKLLKLANITDNVISFNRSENALDWLAKNHTQEGFKDNVLLLDIQMPGTDGFQFLESYAQLSEEVKKKLPCVYAFKQYRSRRYRTCGGQCGCH